MLESRVGWLLRGRRAPVVALTVALALLLVPATATATSPVLEFVTPGNHFPVGFTTASGSVIAELAGFESLVQCEASHGKGEITGPRSTVSEYTFTGCETHRSSNVRCQSAGSHEGEITTGPIEADLVYIDQAKHEVAMLLNPEGGTYIAFKCGNEPAEGLGPFLAPGGPVDKEASVFTVTLNQFGSMQTPDEYEGAGGEELKAIPMGKHGSGGLVTTGVEAMFTVQTSVPVEVRAISAEEVQAKTLEEEAAAKKLREEEAAAKKHQEEEAAAAAAKKRQEEEVAAARKREEQEALRKRLEEQSKRLEEQSKRLEEQTLTELRGAISSVLVPLGAHVKIGALLKHGGLTEAFTAPEPGVLVIQWWRVAPGAHLATNGKHNPVLIAQGSAVFSVAGAGKIKIRPTGAGRRLLSSAKQLKLTASVQFTPTARPPISATKIVSLKR
jgi:hypothetical protein